MLQAVLLIDAEKVRPYDSVWDICCLCSENVTCNGCYSDNCPDYAQCENRKCSIEKRFLGCYACEKDCKRGLLNKIKPYGFTVFIKRYGIEKLLDCLEENEKKESYIIVTESLAIMMILKMWKI